MQTTQPIENFRTRGRFFSRFNETSASRVPTVCVVFGSSTAGGAYVPGMSDYVVMVDEAARVCLAGPPLVKMATNEDANEKELGGAAMHSRVSGVSDYLAASERDGIRIAREIVALLNHRKEGLVPVNPSMSHCMPRTTYSALHPLISNPIRCPRVIARIPMALAFMNLSPNMARRS